uniref:Uncharacterized protein n=1 Tax=Anguilla anguilla TaxID=7936 RepID=A0A0E9WMK0_ANGAN
MSLKIYLKQKGKIYMKLPPRWFLWNGFTYLQSVMSSWKCNGSSHHRNDTDGVRSFDEVLRREPLSCRRR